MGNSTRHTGPQLPGTAVETPELLLLAKMILQEAGDDINEVVAASHVRWAI